MGNDLKKLTPEELQEKRRELKNSSKKSFDIMSELRLGNLDYDMASKKSFSIGG